MESSPRVKNEGPNINRTARHTDVSHDRTLIQTTAKGAVHNLNCTEITANI